MLDIKYIIDNADKVKAALLTRSGSYNIDELIACELSRREIIKQVEILRAKRNADSDKIAMLKRNKQNADELINQMQQLGVELKTLEEQLTKAETDVKNLLLSIPNIPHTSVVAGKSEENNKVVRIVGQPRKFDFEIQAHWDIGEKTGLLDWPRAAKISGSRFTVYKGLMARLERSLISLMLDTHTESGYYEILPPYIVNRASMTGTGQLPKFEEDSFSLKNTDYFLIPTAEVPVTNLHRDEIIDASNLPINYCAYSACFRSEAGSAGRDTRGLIRQHQFNKVELVKFADPDTSYDELEKLTNDAEKILQILELPYRVSMLCSGDLGFCSAKTYDLEVYMPSYNRYVEISSCSNFEDYQARRANIKYRDATGKSKFLHTLNGSGLAIGRTVAAIIENYQNADGNITVPKALIPYMRTEIIK